jgi:hydrogenase expression/formation protein HypC
MCLAVPGQVLELVDEENHLARVDVAGVLRTVNIGLLDDAGPGDWVLIHVGFAMSKIDEAEAARALDGLKMMGDAYTDEMAALIDSDIAAARAASSGGRRQP